MGLFDFINKRSNEKHQLELDFIREKNEIKLQTERDRRDLEISLKRKKLELDEKILEYKIKDQEEKIREDFESYDDEEETDDQDQSMLKMFAPAIAGMMNKQNIPPNNPPTEAVITSTQTSSSVGVTFSDEEISELYKSLPAVYKSVAKTMTDDQIKNFIKGKYPNVAEECLNRMILRIKH